MTFPQSTVASAESLLVRHRLTDRGAKSATDHFLLDGKLYEIRIENVTDESRMREIFDEFIN